MNPQARLHGLMGQSS